MRRIYRRDRQVRRDLDRAILMREGITYLAPEIVLLYKSREPRATNESDVRLALPGLTTEQRVWLRLAIARTRVDHPWVKDLDE